MKYTLLLVDDEINSLKVLSTALSRDYLVETAGSGEEALSLLGKKHYHLVISDFRMPGMDGGVLLEKVKTLYPEMPFILLTAYGTIETAVEAMRKGAHTYLTKPVDLNHLKAMVHEVLVGREHQQRVDSSGRFQFSNLIGKSKPMQEVFSLIRLVSKTDANILILGESGTGKELVARAIHYTSLRSDRPFVPIDCTTIPGELIESELFGYEKGAFTGAADKKVGLIEMAQAGTAFFDEIGDLDLALQKKLLRFLQEKEIRRLGSNEKLAVDVRIVAATNRDLEQAVANGIFRSDLYYRINVITIRIPALRDRRVDIPLIAEYYLKQFCRKNKKVIRGLEPEVLEALSDCDWPGNVRELENVMERAVILCPYDTINVECLPNKLRTSPAQEALEFHELNLPEMEKRIIRRALDKISWNQSRAATLLGISRKTLRTKMKNLGLLPQTG